MQDRKTLLTWACQSWEADKKARAPEDQRDAINDHCENYDKLLRKYGPSYEGLKKKLGYIRGLFDDTD